MDLRDEKPGPFVIQKMTLMDRLLLTLLKRDPYQKTNEATNNRNFQSHMAEQASQEVYNPATGFMVRRAEDSWGYPRTVTDFFSKKTSLLNPDEVRQRREEDQKQGISPEQREALWKEQDALFEKLRNADSKRPKR